jgi:hypothetical protein
MNLRRILTTLVFGLALTVAAGCDNGGGGDGGGGTDTVVGVDTPRGEDTPAADTGPGVDTPAAADVPAGVDTPVAEETVDPPICIGPGIVGQVVTAAGAPISGAKLFLCGTVNGSETCNPRTADAQGYFSFQTLEPGYTHLEVNATLAGLQLGTQFVGYSLAVDLAGPDCLEMGQIVLQDLPAGDVVVTADGGVVEIGVMTLEFPPGCPVFPDFSDQAPVGGAMVDVEAAFWAPEGAVLAAAFHPLKAHCDAGVTVRVAAAAGLTAPVLLYNDVDQGGASEAGAMVPDGDGWVLEGAVPALTWIWITD